MLLLSGDWQLAGLAGSVIRPDYRAGIQAQALGPGVRREAGVLLLGTHSRQPETRHRLRQVALGGVERGRYICRIGAGG